MIPVCRESSGGPVGAFPRKVNGSGSGDWDYLGTGCNLWEVVSPAEESSAGFCVCSVTWQLAGFSIDPELQKLVDY
jgi:hypothetical protein